MSIFQILTLLTAVPILLFSIAQVALPRLRRRAR